MQDPREQVKRIYTGLDRSQWFTAEQLEEIQNSELGRLVLHHYQTSPWFKQRLDQQNLTPIDISTVEGLKRLIPMTKRDIQDAGENFLSKNLPVQHRPTTEAKTSGRTGEPITVVKTRINQLIYWAMGLRDHEWHQRNFSLPLTSVRANSLEYIETDSWGGVVSMFFKTGPGQAIPLNWPIETQLELLEKFKPEALIVHAGVLAAYCTHWDRYGYNLKLKSIRNIGESVNDILRGEVLRITGCHLEDLYSSSEVGCISIECPHSHQHHVMSETLVVEVLDDNNMACQPGEIGRVVVTDLYNTASPLIRYDIGDLAQVGNPCGCGRHLPTLKRILGRRRGLFVRRDGTRFWPVAGQYSASRIVPIRQWQIIQHTLDDIEYKLVTDDPLTEEQHDQLLAVFKEKLQYPNIKIVEYRDSLPIDGKYEESICLVE